MGLGSGILGSSDLLINPNLYDINDFEVAVVQNNDPWRWSRGWVHAQGWAYFASGWLVIFIVVYLHDLWIDRRRLKTCLANSSKHTRRPGSIDNRTFYDRFGTHIRSIFYRRSGKWRFASTSVGSGLFIFAGFLYPVLYVFTQQPYYKALVKEGPPGLASRAGMIAVAQVPFLIALGMKANIVAFLTGVGHERLNQFHRWLSFMCLFFGIVHGLPFIVQPVQEGGFEMLKAQFAKNVVYWNGVAALALLFSICFMALPPFRRMAYEFFAHSHMIMGMAFVAILMWHCNNMLTSWHYLYATFIIWGGGAFYRIFFKTNLFRGGFLKGDRVTISKLTDDGVKLTIPTKLKWKPGQHVFIRIPGISWYDNHPFTIASVMKEKNLVQQFDRERAGLSEEEDYNDLVVVFKPFGGFTKRTYEISRNAPDIAYECFLDGPYGGLPRKLEAFDTVLLIAGGSGITPVVAHLQDLARKMKAGKALTKDVRIVWTVKRFRSLEWFKDEIAAAARMLPPGTVHVQYFITEEVAVTLPDHPVSATKQWPGEVEFPKRPASPTITPATPQTPNPAPTLTPQQAAQFNFFNAPTPPPAGSLYTPTPPPAFPSPTPPPPVGPQYAPMQITPHVPHNSNNPYNPPRSPPPVYCQNQLLPTVEEEQQRLSIYTNTTGTGRSRPVSFIMSRQDISLQIPEKHFSRHSVTPVPDFGDDVMIEYGRPLLRTGLGPWSQTFGRRTCVYVCGPEAMKVDVANAVASLQTDIWATPGREEVYLHSETFGW